MTEKKILYLLGLSPHTRTDRFPILETAGPSDAVLLHQDGVLGLMPACSFLESLRSRGVRIVACGPDCRARAVPVPADSVDWAGFVDLLGAYDVVVS